MAERTTPFRNVKGASNADLGDAMNRVKAEMETLVESLDLKELLHRVQDFGSQKPVSLALAALTIGVAAGVLMRRSIAHLPDQNPHQELR